MEYFRLQQDRRVPYAVFMQGLNGIPNAREAMNGNLTPLAFMNPIRVNSSKFNWYPDVLDQQIFMVKERIQKVFELFLPEMDSRNFCLLDSLNGRYEYYAAPCLDMVDCLSDKSKCNLDKSVVSKIVLNLQKVGQRHIFRIANVNTSIVIISLEAAECILRTRPEGIEIKHIELEC